MGRPASMLEGATPVVSSVSYNPAGQITAITRQYQWDTESRTYNPRGQLTRQTGFGVDISYGFSSTQNDGRIQERQDHISGEKVLYQYDQLGRLISAATEGAGGWGLAWVFDGYGNLRQQNVTKGSLAGFSFSINASTNRINGQTYDANGNWTAQWPMSQTYDIENRISAVIGNQSQQNESYLYSGRNERMVVTRGTENGIKRLPFYGADGLLLGVYRLEIAEQTVYSFPVRLPDQERIYFGGRLMQIGGEWVATDRLGSVVRKGTTNYKYAPYGQEIGGATDNDTTKFATYTRDSLSGLDYALNRYYKPEWGRFTSPDPYQASGGPADPGSWNRYTYVGGDPVNKSDPLGLFEIVSWDGIDLRGINTELSGQDCNQRIFFGFLGVPRCAPSMSWLTPASIIRIMPDSCSYYFTALPTEGVGFYRTNNGSDFYGQAEVIDYIIAVGKLWDSMPDRESVNRPRFGVTGISYALGGPRPPSVSHRTGVDVDIRPIRSDGLEQAVTIDQTEVYDREWTAELIGLFQRNTPSGMYVEAVFFEDRGIDGLRYTPPHRDHFHLRFNTGRTCQ